MKKLFVMLIVLAVVIPVQANVLVNSGFETGDFTGWWTDIHDPVNQNAAVVVDLTSPDPGYYVAELYTVEGWGVRIGQDQPCGGNLPVTVSLDYQIPDGSWVGMGVSVNYYNAAGWEAYGWSLICDYQSTGGGNDWTYYTTAGKPAGSGVGQLEGLWTTPADTITIELFISQWGWGPPPGGHYDSVDLEVPEPATMLLLSIGGLSMLRRKRA